jgi:hypothetical protein
MTINTQVTCADKIAGELQDRQDTLKELFEALDNGADYESSHEVIDEMAYEISTTQVTRVVWSGGGPADYLEIFHCSDYLDRVEYLYEERFDGARLEVKEGSPAWRYAEYILAGIGVL